MKSVDIEKSHNKKEPVKYTGSYFFKFFIVSVKISTITDVTAMVPPGAVSP